MKTPKDYLGHIPGGRVLDVATGSGGFIGFLLEGLQDPAEIVGIDTSERAAAAFGQAFKDTPAVRFESMDAGRMSFPDASFDTVCIANSLHHLPEPARVLSEMLRVLRPGGTLLVLEMFRDGQAESQITHVLLHHWWAAVDRTQQVVHNETYTRAEITTLIAGLGLEELNLHELSDLDGDPHDPEAVKQLGEIIDRYIQRADGHPELQQQGEQLRRRVEEVGFHSAASLLAIGKKP